MNPFIKKEIRLLRPAWTAAILLAIIPAWIASVWSRVPAEVNGYVQLAFGLGVLFLSIASFGEEFSLSTFSSLLSQPMERRRIWLIKTSVLGIAFVSVLLAVAVSWNLDLFFRTARAPDFLTEFGFLALSVAVTFSSGLWATLLLRRMSEAFWLTLLTPLAIMVLLYAFQAHFHWSKQTNNYVVPTVLLLYSLAGFFWARRLFLRAQDTQWTGGEIAFPSRKKISPRITVSYRPGHWFSALVWKELQVYQVNILIAGVVFALDLASVFLRKFHPHFTDPYVRGILELVWLLWLLMPLLIGSAAVAEEHRSGTFESQLCLPVSRRMQFVTKFSVALLLSLLLGGVIPLVIERTLDFNLWICVVAAAIFFISFYASTVARTTIQAIGLTIIVAAAIYFCAVITAVSVFKLGGAWPSARVGLGLLRLYLGVPIFLLTLAGLMYWNFKWLHAERKLRWRNGLAVLGSFAFIFAATNGIYFRAWELLTPAPSPPGPVLLQSSKEIKFAVNGNAIYAVLPDGRLWVDTLALRPGADRLTSWVETVEPNKCKVQFLGGSNWIAVAADQFQAVAIQSDGSLWSLQRRWNPAQSYWSQTGSLEMTRIGLETNWGQAAGGARAFLLLKRDGSLWVWGTNEYDWHNSNSFPKKLKLDLAMSPARFGRQTDWTKLYSSRGAYARKQDGSIWEWTQGMGGTNPASTMVQNTNLADVWPNFVASGNDLWAGIKTHGELWFSEKMRPSPHKIDLRKVQLGKNATWKAVTFGGWPSIVAIRNDGTLWNWSNYWNFFYEHHLAKPMQLGNYSHWVAFPSKQIRGFGAVVLAADGSLWIWDEPSRHVWLAPPRKPVYLGNIFVGR